MKKNFLLAGLLSIIAIFGTVYIYNTFFLDKETRKQEEPAAAVPEKEEPPVAADTAEDVKPLVLLPMEERIGTGTVTLENDVFRLSFSSRGACMVSAVLKRYRNEDGSEVELVLHTAEGIYPFALRSGGFAGEVLDEPFHYRLSPEGDEVSFFRSFTSPDGSIVICRKTFSILPGEYMIRVNIAFETEDGSILPADGAGVLYSLEYGPQIGPPFGDLKEEGDYRYFHVSRNGEKRNMRAPAEGYHSMEGPVEWLGVEGKYFAVLAIPPEDEYALSWDVRTKAEGEERLSFFYSLPAGGDSSTDNTFYYYIGPKDRKILSAYDKSEENGFSLGALNLRRIVPGAPFMLAVADALAFVLKALHAIIPNYGIVIIILTVIIELLILPVTKRSYNATAKLRRIAPEVAQIREKYRYDRDKTMEKLQELYAREEIKGRPNMIPLLVHLPIFLLLYSILGSYVGFRMQPFIPGWIPDISRPDAIWNFYPRVIPLLGWTAIRGLPIMMFATSLIQSRYTQSPDQLGRSMIFMSFLLPILLLFVMYNMPSGVVLYWTVHNVLNIVYQFYRRRGEGER